jgi:hypothetical protein
LTIILKTIIIKQYKKDWGYFTPCMKNNAFTTSIVGEEDCNQFATSESGRITEITASGSY